MTILRQFHTQHSNRHYVAPTLVQDKGRPSILCLIWGIVSIGKTSISVIPVVPSLSCIYSMMMRIENYLANWGDYLDNNAKWLVTITNWLFWIVLYIHIVLVHSINNRIFLRIKEWLMVAMVIHLTEFLILTSSWENTFEVAAGWFDLIHRSSILNLCTAKVCCRCVWWGFLKTNSYTKQFAPHQDDQWEERFKSSWPSTVKSTGNA